MDMIRMTIRVEAGSILLLEGNELAFKVSFDIDSAPPQKVSAKIRPRYCRIFSVSLGGINPGERR